jgi:branched-chain amino acid transport system ATP-binding protein
MTASLEDILLEFRDAHIGYGGLAAVRALNMMVRQGQIAALVGANGAGKSTVLAAAAGLLQPLSGEVECLSSTHRDPLHRRAARGLAMVAEDRSIFRGLTVQENLRLGRGSVDRAVQIFPELEPLLSRKAGLLSGGEQQMLTLGRALAGEPRLLLADELSLGLAPKVVRRLHQALREAADRGVGILMVEQQVRLALRVADHAYVLRRGELVLEGRASHLRERPADIEAAYLARSDTRTPSAELTAAPPA